MKLQQTGVSEFQNSRLLSNARVHVMGKTQTTPPYKINSVFLRTKNFVPKINWQSELLKLKDAQ